MYTKIGAFIGLAFATAQARLLDRMGGEEDKPTEEAKDHIVGICTISALDMKVFLGYKHSANDMTKAFARGVIFEDEKPDDEAENRFYLAYEGIPLVTHPFNSYVQGIKKRDYDEDGEIEWRTKYRFDESLNLVQFGFDPTDPNKLQLYDAQTQVFYGCDYATLVEKKPECETSQMTKARAFKNCFLEGDNDWDDCEDSLTEHHD